MKLRSLLVVTVLVVAGGNAGSLATLAAEPAVSLRFRPAEDGGFTFDTGVLRGRLHAQGKSLGLTGVEHVPTRARLDHGNGLLSHYRVFTRGTRYGVGAWDWPGTARLRDESAVEVTWPATTNRPFVLVALYRLKSPETIEVETRVEARAALPGFETFLASYFDAAFTNALVRVTGPGGPVLTAATPARGDWQMYPRDTAARALIADGRWKLEPNPVSWVTPAEFAGPNATALRSAPGRGLVARLTTPADNCIAIAMPEERNEHYSLYFSLFGRDLKAGESVAVSTTLWVGSGTP